MPRRTVYLVAGLFAAIALCVGLFGRTPQSAASSIRVPTDANEVLEASPLAATDDRGREISALRRALAATPHDLARAVRLARLDIMLARERSDPRYLGHAQAALAPWWSAETPPVDVLVLRATIAQSLHDFESALTDLDRAVRAQPDNAQAWLTRAVVLGVRARYEEARLSCTHVATLASNVISTVCSTGIDSVTGDAEGAYTRLERALARAAISPDEEAWARSSLGEYALRAGRLGEAERNFRRTLELDANDSYARAALADLLLDSGRPQDALAVVRGREVNDTMLLRIALAERRTGAADTVSHIVALGARFDASRLRGDVVHRREEARFWLELKDDATRALALAVENWDVQKEPADARILLEAARAAKQTAAVAPLLAWLSETKLEDPFIAKVARDLREMAPR